MQDRRRAGRRFAIAMALLLIAGVVGGYIVLNTSGHRSSEMRYIASENEQKTILNTYSLVQALTIIKSSGPDSSCEEADYNALSLNRHFNCTMDSWAIYSFQSDALETITNLALHNFSIRGFTSSSSSSNPLQSAMQTGSTAIFYTNNNSNLSIDYRIASANQINGIVNQTGDDGYQTVESSLQKALISLPAAMTKDHGLLAVDLNNYSYDSCTSFFLPVCASHLVSHT